MFSFSFSSKYYLKVYFVISNYLGISLLFTVINSKFNFVWVREYNLYDFSPLKFIGTCQMVPCMVWLSEYFMCIWIEHIPCCCWVVIYVYQVKLVDSIVQLYISLQIVYQFMKEECWNLNCHWDFCFSPHFCQFCLMYSGALFSCRNL